MEGQIKCFYGGRGKRVVNSHEPGISYSCTRSGRNSYSLHIIIEILTMEKEYFIKGWCEPGKVISFRVSWVDDDGEIHVNRGYRNSNACRL